MHGNTKMNGNTSRVTMLKYATAFAVLIAGNAWAVSADAATYAKFSVGQSDAELNGIDLGDGLAYGAGLGTNVGPVRVEAGVDHIAGTLNFGPTIEATALDYHATAYLDLPVGNANLFAGAGLDYVDGEASFFGNTLSAEGDGWHWAVGASYRLAEGLTGEAQFRQISADLDSDFGPVDLDASVVTIGLRLAL